MNECPLCDGEQLLAAVRDYLISPGVSYFQERLTRLAWAYNRTTYGPPLHPSPGEQEYQTWLP